MNIAILSIMYPPDTGGAETYAYELSRSLGELGHNVDVFTATTDPVPQDINLPNNVSIKRLFKRRKIPVIETLYFGISSRLSIDIDTYDIIHGTLMPASTVLLALGPESLDTPVIVTSHGTSYSEFKSHKPQSATDFVLKYALHPINIIMDKFAGKMADRVIAISEHAEQELNERYGLNGKVNLIPHGVNISHFHPCSGSHPAVSESRYTVLTVGRLGPRKNVELALRGIAIAQRQYNMDVELLVAGTGRHKERLQKIAAGEGISEQVTFLGYVEDDTLPLLYSSSDIFALTSTYEGFGLVLLEAMACETPVIGTAVGGVPTVINHGQNGLLIDHNPRAFAHAISHVFNQNNALSNMSSKARKYAEQHSWKHVAQNVEKVYLGSINDE